MRLAVPAGIVAGLVVAAAAIIMAPAASAKAPRTARTKVLLVGSYKGIKGQYKTIQSAVNHAKRPGDWILVAPGDYKTKSYEQGAGRQPRIPSGVLITKPDLTIRGE